MSSSVLKEPVHIFDRLSYVALWVLVVALSLSRIDPTDTSWHLATAREAFATGSWPIVNTFSYTFTNYPLYQQYPLYQSLLYMIWSWFGFEGLSILCSLVFLFIFFLLVRFSNVRPYPFLMIWLLCILGLQQRMVLRPYIASYPLLLLILCCIYSYRNSDTPKKRYVLASGLFVVQCLWVFSHQLYIIGMLIQLGFILSVFVSRFSVPFVDQRDKSIPIAPIAVSLMLSLAAVGCGSLGMQAYVGVAKTFQGLDYLRGHVHELRPLLEVPYALSLVIIGLALYFYTIVSVVKRIDLFELGVLAIFLVMSIVAWRGVAFFVPLVSAVSIRHLGERQSTFRFPGRRIIQSALIVGFVVFVLQVRWFQGNPSLVGQQAGIGKAIGQWPDQLTRHLRVNPPKGNGVNLSWYLGNSLIFDVYPVKKVFVDPRTETYPRDFIEQVFAAEESSSALIKILNDYNARWFVGEMRNRRLWKRAKELISGGDWNLTLIDPISFLLEKRDAQSSGSGKLSGVFDSLKDETEFTKHPALKALQQERVSEFRNCLLGKGDCG